MFKTQIMLAILLNVTLTAIASGLILNELERIREAISVLKPATYHVTTEWVVIKNDELWDVRELVSGKGEK